ncbi:hypothetical protein, partial [Burkholderia pseudomallei]
VKTVLTVASATLFLDRSGKSARDAGRRAAVAPGPAPHRFAARRVLSEVSIGGAFHLTIWSKRFHALGRVAGALDRSILSSTGEPGNWC